MGKTLQNNLLTMYKSALEPHISIRHLNEEIEKLENNNSHNLYYEDIWLNKLRIKTYKERIKLYSV